MGSFLAPFGEMVLKIQFHLNLMNRTYFLWGYVEGLVDILNIGLLIIKGAGNPPKRQTS